MSSEVLLWVIAFYAYLAAGFVLLIAGEKIGKKLCEKEERERKILRDWLNDKEEEE